LQERLEQNLRCEEKQEIMFHPLHVLLGNAILYSYVLIVPIFNVVSNYHIVATSCILCKTVHTPNRHTYFLYNFDYIYFAAIFQHQQNIHNKYQQEWSLFEGVYLTIPKTNQNQQH